MSKKENEEVKEEVTTPEEEKEEETPEDPAQEPEKKSEEEIDYKAELEKVKKQLGQAEYKLDQKRKEDKKQEEEAPKEEVDTEALRQQVLSEAQKEIDKFKLDLAKDTFEEELNNITANEDERELIKTIYENRINKTGFNRSSIKNDLMDARLLANKNKYQKNISEMKETKISDNTKNKGGSVSGEGDGGEEITLSAFEKKIAAQYGLTPEEVRNGINRNK